LFRKTLMGTLLLAKDLYKDELLNSREGEEVKRVIHFDGIFIEAIKKAKLKAGSLCNNGMW